MSTTIWSGLSVGALYGLGAIFLTIPLVRCGVLNFAQGSYLLVASFIAVALWPHWGTALVIVFLVVVGGLLGGVQELLTIRPVRGRIESVLVTTLGVAVALQGFIIAVWGTDPRSLSFFGGDKALTLAGGRLQPVDLWLIGLAVVLGIGFHVAVRHTRWGLLGRAAMTDQVAGMLRGIDIPRLRTTSFVVSGALTFGLAPIAAAKTGVSLESSLHLLVFMFAAAAVGGFGSFAGATVGGFIIGLVEAFCGRYLGVDWAAIVVFGVLAAMLLLRPTGLLGPRHMRVV
jgi:branched-chain amino acid transport system permease protein